MVEVPFGGGNHPRGAGNAALPARRCLNCERTYPTGRSRTAQVRNSCVTPGGEVCRWRASPSGSFVQHRADDETEVGGPFAEPPHEIREPLAPERDVNPHPVAARDERRLKVASNSI